MQGAGNQNPEFGVLQLLVSYRSQSQQPCLLPIEPLDIFEDTLKVILDCIGFYTPCRNFMQLCHIGMERVLINQGNCYILILLKVFPSNRAAAIPA